MAALELLTKLNPKTARLQTTGHGKGLLSWDDVAGALAGLPPESTWYAYALLETSSNDKRGMPNKYTALLVNYLTTKIWGKMREDGFKPRSMAQGVMALGIARAVVHCTLNAKGACSRCGGSGRAMLDGAMKPCKACAGDGVSNFSIQDKIDFGFIDNKPTKHCYAMTYEKYEQFAKAELSSIVQTINDKLSDTLQNAKKII